MEGMAMNAIMLMCLLGLGADSDARPFHELHQAMNTALRREAVAKNLAERGAAVRELCALHREVVADARFAKSGTLQEYRAKIWSRLVHTKTELRQQIARETGRAPAAAEAEEAALLAADSLAASLSLANYSVGGPGYLLARGGGAVVGDNGQELVDLITRTINPQFWDVNGGPGTIVYYAPLQCIVVMATGEIHHQIGGVIGGVR
jgi:hypothetical protein